jgi:hypothetical protein
MDLNVYLGTSAQLNLVIKLWILRLGKACWLYMLSLNDFPVMNVSNVTNKRKEIMLEIMRLLQNYGTVV